MPHVTAASSTNRNRTVPVDNGITITEASLVNIDVTKPLAKAALEASSLIEVDKVAAPKYPELPAAGSTV